MHFKLNKLDTTQLKPFGIHLFQARRGSGKTTLLRQILFDLSRRSTFDLTLVFAPCRSSADMFRRLTVPSLVYDSMRIDVIEKVLSIQRELLAKNKRKSICIVCDDCSYDRSWWRSAPIAELARNGRHSLVTLCITSQSVCDIPSDVRSNVDFIYAFKTGILADRKRLHTHYFGMLSFDSFVKIFEAATNEYGALVCNQAIASNDPEKALSWVRASASLPRFVLSKPIYWKSEARQREQFANEREDASSAIAISVISRR